MNRNNKTVLIQNGYQPKASASSPNKPPSNAPHLVSSVKTNGANRAPAQKPTAGSTSDSPPKKP